MTPNKTPEICNKCGARIRRAVTREAEVILDYDLHYVYQLTSDRTHVIGASYGYRRHECARRDVGGGDKNTSDAHCAEPS